MSNNFRWLKLTLVGLILIISIICVSGTQGSDGDQSNDDLEKEDLRGSELGDGDAEPISFIEDAADEELDESNGGEVSSKKFDWNYHKDDHGIYSGRSLMSTHNIKPMVTEEEGVEEGGRVRNEDGLGTTTSNNSIDETDGKSFKKIKISDDEDLDPLKTIDYAEKEWQLMFRSFDSAYESMSSSMISELGKHTNLMDDILSDLPLACRRDINHIRNSAKQHRLWALKMLDSNGKLPSGVSYGRFSSPGDYEECLSVSVDEFVSIGKRHGKSNNNLIKKQQHPLVEHYKFLGKYCLIDFRLPLPERPRDKLLSIHESVLNLTGTDLYEQHPEIRNYTTYASAFYDVGYLHGFCLPSTCNIVDVTKAIGRALEGLHLIVNNTIDCQEQSVESTSLRKSQVIALFLFGVLFLNAALASIVYYSRESRENSARRRQQAANVCISSKLTVGNKLTMGLKTNTNKDELGEYSDADDDDNGKRINMKDRLRKVLIEDRFYTDCFSIQKNFERLAKPDPRGLAFIHYTRIVAMALTVVTHTAGLGTLQAITKPADASNSEQIFRDFLPQMLANAFTSIQIFFFMAGFMLVISTYPSIRRDKGHLSFVEYAIKRAIRLMPGLTAAICVNFMWPIFVDGPMLTYFIDKIVVPCETNWWRTLGFLSNFDHVEKICLRHSYFSASDYQLHLMAFPLLILLYKHPIISLTLAGLLTVSGFVAQVIMVLTKTVLPFMMVDYIDKDAFFNVVHYIHHPVWNHMSAFFYGFIIGYLVVEQVRIHLRVETIKKIWYILMPLGIASIFAPYFWNHYKRPIYKWQMVIYVIADRLILLTTCAWVSYASMVLARKPKKKPEAPPSIPQVDANNKHEQEAKLCLSQNLPEPQQNMSQQNKSKDSDVAVPTIEILESDGNRLKLAESQCILPRQRSTPNIQSYLTTEQQVTDQAALSLGGRPNRTVSSSNLANISTTTPSEQNIETTFRVPETSNRENQTPSNNHPRPQHNQNSPTSPKTSPVSNVNTLCLILSRLTFQLYLFNMVVLWIDVNNSRYFWFFSYYFIIMKSFAVYICAAIFAMTFFITLESPSLTLYIAWVKNRAGARAKQQKLAPNTLKSANHVTKIELANINKQLQDQQPQTVSLTPDRRSSNPSISGRSNVGGLSFDSLGVKPGSLETESPTFSYIDIDSTPAERPALVLDGSNERPVDVEKTKI